jgi:heptosyltransferase-1
VSDFDCSPCYKRTCFLKQADNGQPVCMDKIDAESVWRRLEAYLPAQ